MNRRCKTCGQEKPLDRYHFRVVQAKQRPTRYADIDTCIAAVKALIAERGKQ